MHLCPQQQNSKGDQPCMSIPQKGSEWRPPITRLMPRRGFLSTVGLSALTGEFLPDLLWWRGETLKVAYDHSA